MENFNPDLCNHCQKNKIEVESADMCQSCYDDGWRGGQEMIDAFRADPEFGINDDGQITVIPDYKKKWSKHDK